MSRTVKLSSILLFILVFGISSIVPAGTMPTAKPEEVGFSSERLQKIHELMQRNIDAGNFAGAVTLVARQGRIVHFETHGMMDLDAKKPMAKAAIFRIMSMTKPIVGVSVLMMIEEGKVRLSDPVSKFIPQFKDLNVAVPLPSPPPTPRGPPFANTSGIQVLYHAGRAGNHDSRLDDPYLGTRQRPNQHEPKRKSEL